MKLIDQLIARAAAADARMGQLAARERNAERRKQAFAQLERELERMMQDGLLDQGELEELMGAFRGQGLDTSTLEGIAQDLRERDGVVGAEIDGDLRDDLLGEIRDAKAELHDPNFMFEAQELVTEYQQSFDLASRVLKAEHEMYMSAIRNLKA